MKTTEKVDDVLKRINQFFVAVHGKMQIPFVPASENVPVPNPQWLGQYLAGLKSQIASLQMQNIVLDSYVTAVISPSMGVFEDDVVANLEQHLADLENAKAEGEASAKSKIIQPGLGDGTVRASAPGPKFGGFYKG